MASQNTFKMYLLLIASDYRYFKPNQAVFADRSWGKQNVWIFYIVANNI